MFRIVSILLVLVSACGDSGSKSGDTSAADTSVATSTGATDTSVTPDGDATVGPGACQGADDCASDEMCTCDGQCVPVAGNACSEDRNCGTPRWCNTCTKHCEQQAELCEPCTDSRGCQEDGACLTFASGGTFCGRACVTAAGCPQGYDCDDVGVGEKQCVPKSGACDALGLCQSDSACPIGQICNDATHACGPGCSEDGQCPGAGANVCVLGRCVPPCGESNPCATPAECVSGHCKIPGACESAADCPDAATYCDRVTGMCQAGCLVSEDCKDAAQECKSGACVAKGCLHNYECAFGNVCDHSNGQCVPFPASEPQCAVCDASQEDPPGCGEPNLCVTFQDQNDVARGDFCLVPCKDDPIDRCPSGWQCTKLEAQDEPPKFMCTRQCYTNPVQ